MKKNEILTPNMINALKIICQKLEGKNIQWAIVSSCALALHEVDCQPCDIDILTDKEGAFFINELLKEYIVVPVGKRSSSEMFESHLGSFLVANVHVDIMGDLKVKSRHDNKWHSMATMLKSSEIMEVNGQKVPVASLQENLAFYEKSGREKDLVKIRKLKNVKSR